MHFFFTRTVINPLAMSPNNYNGFRQKCTESYSGGRNDPQGVKYLFLNVDIHIHKSFEMNPFDDANKALESRTGPEFGLRFGAMNRFRT